jgi:3-oxoadipate enol-lactonase
LRTRRASPRSASSTPPPGTAPTLPDWEQRANAALASGLSSLIDFQLTRWFGDKFRAENPQTVADSVDTFLRNDPNAYAETCRMLGACDLRAGLASIKVPAAILVGEEDYATPLAMAQAMHQGIAASTLTVLPGARHLTPLERPDQIAAELQQLLRRARGAPSAR